MTQHGHIKASEHINEQLCTAFLKLTALESGAQASRDGVLEEGGEYRADTENTPTSQSSKPSRRVTGATMALTELRAIGE